MLRSVTWLSRMPGRSAWTPLKITTELPSLATKYWVWLHL